MNWADSHVEEGGSLVMDWDRLHGAFLSEASENEKVSIDSAPTGQNKGVRSVPDTFFLAPDCESTTSWVFFCSSEFPLVGHPEKLQLLR